MEADLNAFAQWKLKFECAADAIPKKRVEYLGFAEKLGETIAAFEIMIRKLRESC